MFGGLEIKGTTPTKDADDEPDPTSEPSVPAASSPGLSSFGFMNVPSPEAAAPTPAVSSFSFMNSTAPEPASETPTEPVPAAPAAATSGFSFMMQDSATATTESNEEKNSPAAPAVAASGFSFMTQESTTTATEPTFENTAPAAPAAATGGFSFMQETAATATEPSAEGSGTAAPAAATSGFSFMMQESTTTTTEPTAQTPSAPAPAPSSGFDFMNSMAPPAASDAAAPAAAAGETSIPTIAEESPAPVKPASSGGFWSLSETPMTEIPPTMPTTIHTRTNSVSSASSALSAPSVTPAPNSTPAKTGGLVAGAGVTFGTSAAKPSIKRKKKRAARVGIGATTTAATPAPAPAPVPAPTPSAPPEENETSRDAALEATNRAEAFMQAKTMEEAKSSTETTATTAVSSSAAALKTESVADLGIEPTESTDEVLVAAKEAAEQAKILQHQQKGKGSGFMGTFFKGFRPGPNTTSVSSSGPMGNNSKHSVSSRSIGSNSTGKAVDRMAKEQQAMKQAMAKQEQQQTKQPTVSESEDDDVVMVSTSVGDYKPASAEPMEYTPVTADADAITKTTIAEKSTFVPVSIPLASTQKSSFSFVVPSYGEPQPSVETPVEPKVKMNNTPKDIFEHHQEYFSESVNRAMKKVEDARSLKNGLLEERFVALAKDRFATREIEQMEELLQAAIDEEDYEQADELGQKVDAHKREKSEVENMLASNKSALEKLESESTSFGELVVSCFEDLALRLDDLKKKEVASEKKDDNETLTQYASISKQLSTEHERLQQDLKHLERDEQLVGEERKELEDSINDQTGEIMEQKEEAESKLTEVDKEIEDLRNALQMKQKEAADLRTQMFGFEDSISKVRVKFSRQLTRVDKKEVSVKESRREWEVENEQHKKQKEAHELQVKTHSDTLLAHEELMKMLESELQLSKEFSEIIPTQLGFMEEETETEEKDGDDEESLAQLKANVVKCEGAIDVVKKSLKMASTAIQNLQNERDMLIARIPELETQKKAAAASRNFKAAGKFSKEIKDANARIKACEDDLNGETKEKKASAEEDLRKLDSELLEAKKVADAKEKLSGEKRMEILAKKIAQLVEEKLEKCGESESEGKGVKSVAARVLEGQIKILKDEGHEIGSKYGGWDELMASICPHEAEAKSSVKELDQNPSSSVDQEDSQENVVGRLTSEERLGKAKELLAKCSDLEVKVYDAAEREDFEAAGELQEALDKINIEIEELNITDEECLLLAEMDTAPDTSPPEEEQQEQLTPEERLAKAKELITRQSDLEQKVEEAAEKEDFEAAEEMQTTLDQVSAELTELNITDEERELLAAEGSSSDLQAPSQDVKETLSGLEEEKKENIEENASDLDHDKLENGEDAETHVDPELVDPAVTDEE